MSGRIACFTLDLEPDFLTRDSHEVLLDDKRFHAFENFCLRNELPLSVFVVARMLDQGLPVRERFANLDAQFELHSYSHNPLEPDSRAEIVRGKRAFERYFGTPPRGYRAPNGAISQNGLYTLDQEDFLYDASIFPTLRPELGYNFSKLPTEPWRYAELPGIIELPFGVVPRVRAVISLSFLKLLGLRSYRLMCRLFGFSKILVIDSHLYDYFPTSAVLTLSRANWRRYPLLRNQDKTMSLLQAFIDFLRKQEYSFVSMNELYASQACQQLPLVSTSAIKQGT